ncbi:DoxX family protein [Lentzea sp. NPDC060358]|uniref:DoxX family protein n=1 Tax=Lentzea sp. NPDC060358 TaxID=3347103 RepID=UPI003663CCDD
MDRLRDVVLLLARVVIGVVFVMHGYLKLSHAELGPAAFESLGLPLPAVTFWAVSLAEVVGGVAFAVGLGLPVVGAVFAALTAGALFLVHLSKGFWADGGGYEYVMVLAVVSPAIGLTARRWSLDELIAARRSAVAV